MKRKQIKKNDQKESGQVFIEFLLLLALVSVLSTAFIIGMGNVFAVFWKSMIEVITETTLTFR